MPDLSQNPCRHKMKDGGTPVRYKKITLELITVADEADAVIGELNSTLDRLDEEHTIFGGAIETQEFEHSGTRRRSALAHTIAAGATAAAGLRTARNAMHVALRAVI